LGAYGFLGLIEHKKAFILPIKSSLSNLSYFSNNLQLKVPYLKKITEELKSNSILNHYINKRRMTIKIQSFSFKKGLPTDETEHGGGYIFDCRSIHNPGRYEEYKQKTGKDKEVQAFFESNTEMAEFLALVFELSSKHIDKYLNRNFDYLSIAFGCTGGQHRSVYSAEKLNTYLKLKYQDKIKIELSHREFPNL
jgi:RNase adaptor protein for sRNA GlmZ degradation